MKNDDKKSDKPKAEKKPKTVKLVPMVRDDGKTADVHPSEVDNYKAGGYKEVD